MTDLSVKGVLPELFSAAHDGVIKTPAPAISFDISAPSAP